MDLNAEPCNVVQASTGVWRERQHKGQSDGGRQQTQDSIRGFFSPPPVSVHAGTIGRPGGGGGARLNHRHHNMHRAVPSRGNSRESRWAYNSPPTRRLEKQQARHPDRGRAAEPGQMHLGDQGSTSKSIQGREKFEIRRQKTPMLALPPSESGFGHFPLPIAFCGAPGSPVPPHYLSRGPFASTFQRSAPFDPRAIPAILRQVLARLSWRRFFYRSQPLHGPAPAGSWAGAGRDVVCVDNLNALTMSGLERCAPQAVAGGKNFHLPETVYRRPRRHVKLAEAFSAPEARPSPGGAGGRAYS